MDVLAVRCVGCQHRIRGVAGPFGPVDIAPDQASAKFQLDGGVLLVDVVKRGLVDLVKILSDRVGHFSIQRMDFVLPTTTAFLNGQETGKERVELGRYMVIAAVELNGV